MSEDEARETIKSFLVVIDDASNYLFSRNHSVPYSMVGFFIGWLRYYYKIELLTSALNVYVDNTEKVSNIKEYIKSQLNFRADELRKQTIDSFVQKCVDEMKQWYWNEDLHSKTTDPLIIDDMTSNAINTIKQIANEIKENK